MSDAAMNAYKAASSRPSPLRSIAIPTPADLCIHIRSVLIVASRKA